MKTIASLLLIAAGLGAVPTAASVVTWTADDKLIHDGSSATAPIYASQLVAIRGNARYDQLVIAHLATVNFGVHADGAWYNFTAAQYGESGKLSAILPAKAFTPVTFDAIGVNDGGGSSFGLAFCGSAGGCFSGMAGTQFIFAKPREAIWTGTDTIGGDAEFAVTPFAADRFLGATGTGTLGQIPVLSAQAGQLWAHVDGVWTFVTGTAYGATGSLSTLFAPSSFTGGTIDRLALLRVDANGIRSNFPASLCSALSACFQHMDLESFQFGLAGSVPEPSSWAMLIAGFGMAGGAMRRRRTADAVA